MHNHKYNRLSNASPNSILTSLKSLNKLNMALYIAQNTIVLAVWVKNFTIIINLQILHTNYIILKTTIKNSLQFFFKYKKMIWNKPEHHYP